MVKEITKEDLQLDYGDLDYRNMDGEDEIVGQERALEALRLGFMIDRPGYNIYVSGDESTARMSAVKREVGKIDGEISNLFDVAYAFNAKNPKSPLCLVFPSGKAEQFQKGLDSLAEGKTSKEELKAAFPYNKIAHFIDLLPSKDENANAYRLNIILNRKDAKRRPLVIESHPSHDALFGFAEKDVRDAHLAYNAGSYQMASGGFLVLSAEEILAEKGLWTTLKRYINMSEEAMTSSAVQGELIGSIRPYPIAKRTKVILIGSDDTYDMLAEKDEQFLRLFKICPEFDYQMERNEKNIRGTVAYLKRNGKDLLPLSNSAYQEILRYSSWFSEDRNMLTTQLSILGDLKNEADIAARKKSKSEIDGEAVKEAIEKRGELASLTEDRINREIKDGEILISLEGMLVGTLNGLAVIDRGLASFGTPTVISATAAPGNEGIINIEHEAGLSGGIHDKGLLILEGYLRHRYARTFPLSLYAGICFEQSYGEVDGDSASSAELFALLSAIGEIPLRQDIAVTGSVNQMGKLQPVGAINEKIEGFYNACKTSGLTGKQGVIIPMQNIQSLILPYEIEEKIGEGMFHIYAISSIDEGMELLSERKAGERGAKGLFPVGTINRAIEDGLKRLYASSQKN